MKDVSIIIPTYNRPDDLDCVLPYYVNQPDVLEVIIVDDGSSLSYNEVIDKYKKMAKVNIVYHRNETNLGAGAGRNIGLSLTNGRYILWGEDDAFLSENYVRVLKNKIKEKEIVFGSIYYGIHPTMCADEQKKIIRSQQCSDRKLFDYENLEGYYRLKTETDVKVPWGHALLMTTKEAYTGIRYYEGYKVNGYREETDAQVQISKRGYSIIYTSETCCYHFPARNSNGGQHSSRILKYELYKIINNNIFLDRHYDFFKESFPNLRSKLAYKYSFAKMVFTSLTKRLYNKIYLLIK